MFEGRLPSHESTPDELGLEDGDVIDAMVGSIGIFVCDESSVGNHGITLATSAPGAQWLLQPTLPRTPPFF
jgi:hypothetical protein